MACVPRELGLCSHLRVPLPGWCHWVGAVSPAEAPREERTVQPWAGARRGHSWILTGKLSLGSEVGGVAKSTGAGRAGPAWLLTIPAHPGERAGLPAAAVARGGPARATVADAVPRLSLRSPAELLAARGSPGAARDPATLLPSSTRVLLKRRQLAELERELQSRRQVRLPQVCHGDTAAGSVSPAEHGHPALGTLQSHRSFSRGPRPCHGGRCRAQAVPPQPSRAARSPGQPGGSAGPRHAAAIIHPCAAQEAAAGGAGAGAAEPAAQRQQELARRQEQHRDAVLSFDSFLKAVAGLAPLASQPPLPAQFQDVPAMLEHFGVLAGVRAALAREAEAGQELLAQGRAQLERYCQESSTQLLGTRDELARLHTRLEAVRRDVLQWESRWTHIQSTATQKSLLLGQIKLAVLNLFQQMTAQLRIPMDRAQEDTKAQLDMVLRCMQGLADVCATGTHPQNHRSARLLRDQE
ncbi:PREDICTED: uncharacterized protein LOC101809147 [Ficedula albicollis]|uniref:uncharacterized protein LOC101809147 n=1 Tax=Ficedula albicollis TaxID=59894 RepID=UPI0007AD81E6|nr:PREDICTED: uncharacterized protein LOC101809147 [Ficedula albicollis]